MRRIRRNSPALRLEMTPLIDVVFLLLTFFLFAMMVMVRVDILGVRLPTIAAGAPAEERDVIAVTLDAQGAASIDGAVMTLDQIVDAVLDKRTANPETLVFVAADEACDAGKLLGVLDRFAQAGVGDVSLVGTPAGPAPTPE